ncbi:UNVERIFIED_CONTAM: hypothetical protein Sradi_4191200 [Sesamum radiatum]|uniref:Uncharacterized protein n=1 Tax=Sesamum radiatum TaxID=300843 RepID=A0AAW2P316_SESRA
MEKKELSKWLRFLQLVAGRVLPLVLFGMLNVITVWEMVIAWRMRTESHSVTMVMLRVLYYVIVTLSLLELIAFADYNKPDTVKPGDARNTPTLDLEENPRSTSVEHVQEV